jgi:hypothetical protein
MPTKHSSGPSDYPDSYLSCRIYGHAWNDQREHWKPVHEGRKLVGYDREVPCFRCPCVQFAEFDRNLNQVSRSKIDYPDGYLIAKDTEKIPRTVARLERVKRVTGKSHLRRVQ